MNASYTTAEVLRILGVTEQELRACLRAALYPARGNSQPRRFSFEDLILLRTAKGLCQAGIPVGRIRRMLESLKRQLPPEQQLTTIKIYADGRRVVVWDETGRWQPDSGQFVLNFEAGDMAGAPRVKTLTTRRRASEPSAQQWLDRGMNLEESSPEEARRAYQEALRLDPSLVDAHINLGFLLHRDGRLADAEQCYRAAIAYAPGEILGYFNLAVVLEDQGDRKGAIEAYAGVIARRPYFKDAHHNIALLYEAEGRQADAIRHYSMARKLSQGETASTTRKGKGRKPHNPFRPV
jgi:tetratricopeptide (TPR) repeat protein